MKRGLITWDRTEIPPGAFEQRVDRVRRVLTARDLSALVVYSDLWRSNQARFFSNYMPYFNRALLIIPREFPLTLLCGLSPRVYGWIRSVTTIEDVRPAGNFANPLFEIASERKWARIGALRLDQLPYDIHQAIRGGGLAVENVEPAGVYAPAEDETESAMRRKAAALAEEILAEEMPDGVGSVDHHFVGRLERRFRRGGAEDLVTLLTNGRTVPMPPIGVRLEENFSVSLALEYRGHWVRLSRPQGSMEVLAECRELWRSSGDGLRMPVLGNVHAVPRIHEYLDGSYPYECGSGDINALHIELHLSGKRLFYGGAIL